MHALIGQLEKHPLVTGWFGTVSSVASVITTMQSQIVLFQWVTGLLGVIITALTLAITWRNFCRKGGKSEE